jgi:hypothetical protein
LCARRAGHIDDALRPPQDRTRCADCAAMMIVKEPKMSKPQDTKKEKKKQPQKNAKEKRQEKRDKKK